MPKLFRVEITGDPNVARGRANYQLMAETAADAVIASIRRWTAADRSNDEITFINLAQDGREVIEVEGRVDLHNIEFLSNDVGVPQEPEEAVVHHDGHSF